MYDDWMKDIPIFVDKGTRERKMEEKIGELERRIKNLEKGE